MYIRLLIAVHFFYVLPATTVYGQKTASNEPSYEKMPPAPENYRPGNVLVRMIDGLGYRFYWATEGLHSEDLEYRPTDEARSTAETIDHILSLTTWIANVTEGASAKEINQGKSRSWSEKRAQVLHNLWQTRQWLVDREEEELAALRIITGNRKGAAELPYWNMINGPIADAIYHTGQIVVLRRISGNPMSSKVDVFRGENRP